MSPEAEAKSRALLADEMAAREECFRVMDRAREEAAQRKANQEARRAAVASQRYGLKGSGFPQTAAEWADREEKRLDGLETARERLAAKAAGETTLPDMPTLSELLSLPEEDTRFRIDGLVPVGGRIILSAPMKAGKTTFVGNLIRSLVDGVPFLGRFDTMPIADDATVAVFDTEMSQTQMVRWLRDQRMTNTGRVIPVSLRGQVGTFDIKNKAVRAEWAKRLISANAEVLILDPLNPVLSAFGANENDNTDVGAILGALDALMYEAGIKELFIMHHMGHDGERARGASKLGDWPDAEWQIRKVDKDDPTRYFWAYGRDVDVPETRMEYDTETRHLTIMDPWSGEPDNRKTAKTRGRFEEHKAVILQYIQENPGCTGSQMWADTGIKSERGGTTARDALVEAGLVRTEQRGRAQLHYPAEGEE